MKNCISIALISIFLFQIKFHNTKHGRHLLRQNFDATTAAGKHINPNLSNRVFINSYEALSGTGEEYLM